MITLKNIRKNGDFIEAHYYAGIDKTQEGFIRINGKTGEVAELVKVGYGISHAISKLKSLFASDNIPETVTVSWF